MDADVVIVGGGPAGCAAAISLRAKGHSVVVLAAPEQREKPTETAAPALKDMLRTLGADTALSSCEPCFGFSSNWGRASPVLQPSLLNPFGHPWFIHRGRFDPELRRIAQDKGTVWLEATASSADFSDHGIAVETAGGTTVNARWLIAATGTPSWPARMTNQKVSLIDSLIAFWASIPTEEPLERLLFLEATASGWWYLCPGHGPTAVACFVTDPESARELRPSHTKEWGDQFKATALFNRARRGAAPTEIHAVPVNMMTLPEITGNRWIAVGDATAKLDPLGSSGVLTALDSGRRGALAVSEALHGSSNGIDRYGLWSAGLLREFFRQREQQYSLEAQQRGGAFWARRTPQHILCTNPSLRSQ